MRLYVNTNFKGHYPAGTAAIVFAKDPERAAKLPEEKLESIGLKQTIDPKTMRLMRCGEGAIILNDGNY